MKTPNAARAHHASLRTFCTRCAITALAALAATAIGCGNTQLAREFRQSFAPDLKNGLNTILTGVVSAGLDTVNSNANDNSGSAATTTP